MGVGGADPPPPWGSMPRPVKGNGEGDGAAVSAHGTCQGQPAGVARPTPASGWGRVGQSLCFTPSALQAEAATSS